MQMHAITLLTFWHSLLERTIGYLLLERNAFVNFNKFWRGTIDPMHTLLIQYTNFLSLLMSKFYKILVKQIDFRWKYIIFGVGIFKIQITSPRTAFFDIPFSFSQIWRIIYSAEVGSQYISWQKHYSLLFNRFFWRL